MRAIMDNTPSIVAVKDLEGRYMMANAEVGRLVGIARRRACRPRVHGPVPGDVAQQLRANDRARPRASRCSTRRS